MPIRLDFGQRDLDSNKIMCTSRIGNKESINLEDLEEEINKKMDAVHETMIEMSNKIKTSKRITRIN